MAVCSACSTRIASAATAAPKAATATFIVVSNDNTDTGHFQENLGDCSQWHVHCKITWKWIPHVQNNILTAASVRNYHYSLRNNPEWRSFQLLRNYEKKSYRKRCSWRRFPRAWLRTQCIIRKGLWQFSKHLTEHPALYPVTYSYKQSKRPLPIDVIPNQLNIYSQPPSHFPSPVLHSNSPRTLQFTVHPDTPTALSSSPQALTPSKLTCN